MAQPNAKFLFDQTDQAFEQAEPLAMVVTELQLIGQIRCVPSHQSPLFRFFCSVLFYISENKLSLLIFCDWVSMNVRCFRFWYKTKRSMSPFTPASSCHNKGRFRFCVANIMERKDQVVSFFSLLNFFLLFYFLKYITHWQYTPKWRRRTEDRMPPTQKTARQVHVTLSQLLATIATHATHMHKMSNIVTVSKFCFRTNCKLTDEKASWGSYEKMTRNSAALVCQHLTQQVSSSISQENELADIFPGSFSSDNVWGCRVSPQRE